MSALGTVDPRRAYVDLDGGDWTDAAVCRGADQEQFYPDPGRGARAAYEAAKEKYCLDCTVRLPCLRRGLAGETRAFQRQGRYGLFGGLTPVERAQPEVVARVIAELEQKETADA